MKRELNRTQLIEQSITKTYRKEIWTPFIGAVKHYKLIEKNDRIAVCISGGKDSMLLALMMKMLNRVSEVPFELVFLSMNPGYNEENAKKIEENARILELDLEKFSTDIFNVSEKQTKNPCYLCAKMRRGHLYAKARELGCNKIALGHHFSDVIETTVMAMFYGAQLQAMPPMLRSTNYEGMSLIRPLYRVHEEDIIRWAKHNDLHFIACACSMTEKSVIDENASKRKEIKNLIKKLKKTNPDIEKSIFNSIHNVCLDTFPGYKSEGKVHSFLERYEKNFK